MSRPTIPMSLGFGTGAGGADDQLAAAGSSPTRRRLLTLIAALPAAQPPYASVPAPSRSHSRAAADLTPRLFAEVQVWLAEHKRALLTCDRLEAALVAEFGYPRVRLPGTDGLPDRFAADLETVALHVPSERRRTRLQHLLQRKQARWADAVQACDLTRAQEREEALFRAVPVAADSLYIVPATALSGLMLKLAVLLSLEEPGGIERDVSPWRDLRLILIDLNAIATAASADR